MVIVLIMMIVLGVTLAGAFLTRGVMALASTLDGLRATRKYLLKSRLTRYRRSDLAVVYQYC
jgi:hypothetical protein